MEKAPLRLQILQGSLDGADNAKYLEIGVSRGLTFAQIKADTKVAVDPAFKFRVPFGAHVRRLARRNTGELYYSLLSDVFFAEHAPRLFGESGVNTVFVDGLHEWRQALRDIEHALEYLVPHGCIVVHDCNPLSQSAAAPSLADAIEMDGYNGTWNGDVYKAIVHLRSTRRDLDVVVVDADQGLGVVRWRHNATGDQQSAVPSAEALSYVEFERDREQLLNLVPVDKWAANEKTA